MKPLHLVFLLALLALTAAGSLQAALVAPRQEPQQALVLAPTRHPAWNSLIVESDRPQMLLEVPKGRRFVLTDLLTASHEDYRNFTPSGSDRIWLESADGQRRKVILDALLVELPHHEAHEGGFFHPLPLRFETGFVVTAGEQLWLNYRFAGNDRQDWMRRVTWSGYYEDLPAR